MSGSDNFKAESRLYNCQVQIVERCPRDFLDVEDSPRRFRAREPLAVFECVRVQKRGWTERLLSSSLSHKSPSSSSSSSSSRRNGRPVLTPTVSYHSTVTYRGDLDALSRRFSLPTSAAASGGTSAAALQRKVRFAEPPESSVIEIESRRRRGEHSGRAPRRSLSSTVSGTGGGGMMAADDWLASASDTEYFSASSLTEKLDRLELENALASAAMKRSRPFHHHHHHQQQQQQHHPQYQMYQQPQHDIGMNFVVVLSHRNSLNNRKTKNSCDQQHFGG